MILGQKSNGALRRAEYAKYLPPQDRLPNGCYTCIHSGFQGRNLYCSLHHINVQKFGVCPYIKESEK